MFTEPAEVSNNGRKALSILSLYDTSPSDLYPKSFPVAVDPRTKQILTIANLFADLLILLWKDTFLFHCKLRHIRQELDACQRLVLIVQPLRRLFRIALFYEYLVGSIQFFDDVERQVLQSGGQREAEAFRGFVRHRHYVAAQVFCLCDNG